jgi:hypothetical protein
MSGLGEFANSMDRLARNLNERNAQRLEMEQYERSHRVTAWGHLGPGDPPPLPQGASSVLDYRGLTPPEDLQSLQMNEVDGRYFPAGAAVEVRTPMNGFRPGPAFWIGVPFELLREHAVIVGRSGSGKTRYVVVPWIYTALQSSSVVALDAKGDMLQLVKEHADRWGSPGVTGGKWDYTDPANSMSWDWIAELDNDDSLDAALTAILGRADKQGSSEPFFYQRDRQLLGGLLQLAKPLGLHSASGLLAVLADQEKVEDIISRYKGTRGAVQVQATVGGFDALTYRKVTQGVVSALQQLATPSIDKVTAPGRHRLRLDDVVSGRHLLVVVAPVQGGYTSAILSGLFLNLFVQRLYRRFTAAKGQVFLFIDEAPRFIDRFDFASTLSVARSAKASVVLALQDVAQFKEETERSAVISNCATWLSLSGVEKSSVEFLQGRLGKHNVPFWSQGSFSHRAGVDLRTQVESRPVLGEREIAFPPGGRPAILHMKSPYLPTSPILVDLEPQAWEWKVT